MLRITYVSSVQVHLVNTSVVEQIVHESVARNNKNGITGGLVYTGKYFAQTIEGPDQATRTTFEYIEKDDRHTVAAIIESVQVDSRLFETWSLAYSGQATYINRPIESLMRGEPPREFFIKAIMSTMLSFAAS